MQTLAVRIQPASNLGIAAQRFDELEIRVTGVEVGEADPRARDFFARGHSQAERA
jgi:hypothetical protein